MLMFPRTPCSAFFSHGQQTASINLLSIPSPHFTIFLKTLPMKPNQQIQVPALQTRPKLQPQFSTGLIISTAIFRRQLKFNVSKNLGHYILPSITHQFCAPLPTCLDNGNTNLPCHLSLNLRISFSFLFSISSSTLLATKFYEFNLKVLNLSFPMLLVQVLIIFCLNYKQ